MARVEHWSRQYAQQQLAKRLYAAMEARKPQEAKWRNNELVIYNTDGALDEFNQANGGFGAATQNGDGPPIGINYSFKNFRFIHAQMSANPPSVVPRPTSNDPNDRRAADAADRCIRYGIRQYTMQENQDLTTLSTLLYGTGVTKNFWDPHAGVALAVDDETGEITMEGDYRQMVPDIWRIYIDPDATSAAELNFVFEEVLIDWDTAVAKFPDHVEVLKRYRKQSDGSTYSDLDSRGAGQGHSQSYLRKSYYDVVRLFEYWERGTLSNGFLGRYCLCTEQGELVTELMENPEKAVPKKSQGGLPMAVLPYNFLTDIDVPGQVWGKSSVEYSFSLQLNLNRIDSATLENVEAHGVARLVLLGGASITEDSITNSPLDIIKTDSQQPPIFTPPMQLPAAMNELMMRYEKGINDTYGTNESMFGQQSRETSGFSMQYATNQGNMIRRRLFNKYVQYIENNYRAYLRILQQKWSTERTIWVLGKEKAFETMDLKGADLMGGYEFVSEYGTALSLDPTTRREEIITLMPVFEKAGVEGRQILGMLKLNDVGSMYNLIDLANDRQREIFDEMCARMIYQAPRRGQDHLNMIAYGKYYVMTSEFKYLKEEQKQLIEQHISEREVLMAQEAGQQQQLVAQAAPQPPAVAQGSSSTGGLDLAALTSGDVSGLAI